ncbi:hypothetical protein FHG87_002977 [Trinorchestia longiramus]|nr:hypothetical protein FHG87_002977 [Trinorchestia longiramus]
MRAATEGDIKMRIGWGHAGRHYHKMVYDHQQWDYIATLQDDLLAAKQRASTEGHPWFLDANDDLPRLKGIWDIVYPRAVLQTASFKEYSYRLQRVASGSSQTLQVEERLHGELTWPKLDIAKCTCTQILPLVCRNFVPFVKFFAVMLYYRIKKKFLFASPE